MIAFMIACVSIAFVVITVASILFAKWIVARDLELEMAKATVKYKKAIHSSLDAQSPNVMHREADTAFATIALIEKEKEARARAWDDHAVELEKRAREEELGGYPELANEPLELALKARKHALEIRKGKE